MENSVENMRLSTESTGENCDTSPGVERADQTLPPTPNGVAEGTSPATENSTTPVHSGLSEYEKMKLAVIQRNRNRGWVPSMLETDFLLELIDKLRG